MAKYGDKILYVVKHFPLEDIHDQAKVAAMAAQCANREQHYWEMERTLFSGAPDTIKVIVSESGRALGLGRAFEDCISNESTATEVAQDIEDGLSIGVRGTPTFVINDKLISGAVPMQQWELLLGRRF